MQSRSLSAGDEIMDAVLTDVRGCEFAEIAGISCDFDATTRFNRLSNIARGGVAPVSSDLLVIHLVTQTVGLHWN